jgi:hypothetical protein
MKPGSCSGVKGAANGCDSLERPLLRRESVETYPPFSRENFLSGTDYGRDGRFRAESGLEWLSDLPALSSDSRTIPRRNFAVQSDSRSGLIMGDSLGFGKEDRSLPSGELVIPVRRADVRNGK